MNITYITSTLIIIALFVCGSSLHATTGNESEIILNEFTRGHQIVSVKKRTRGGNQASRRQLALPGKRQNSMTSVFTAGQLKFESRNTVNTDIVVDAGAELNIGGISFGTETKSQMRSNVSQKYNQENNSTITKDLHKVIETIIYNQCQDSSDEKCVEKMCRKEGCYFVDGCSAPSSVDYFEKYNPIFGNAEGCSCENKKSAPCNNHDRCYQTKGSNQEDCDIDLYIDMTQECRNRFGVGSNDLDECYKAAERYYLGLRVFGWFAHKKRQDEAKEANRTW